MPFDPHENHVASTVATAPSPAASGTSLVLASGEGAIFPDPATAGPYNVAVQAANEIPKRNSGNVEVIRVGAKSGDTLSGLIRAQEGSSARTIIVGDQVALAATKKVFDDIEDMLPLVISDIDRTVGGSSQYMMPGWYWAGAATGALIAGLVPFIPMYSRRTLSIDRIAIHIPGGGESATGGALARLALYSAAFVDPNRQFIKPDTLVVDGGTVGVDTSGGKQVTVDVEVRGWFYVAVVADAEIPAVTIPTSAVSPPVQGGTNSVSGTTYDHIIPFVTGKTSYVSGGFPSTADLTGANTATHARAYGRVRMKA